ncbi:non-cell-autonomous protein pathway2, partial [Genlisea aurea]
EIEVYEIKYGDNFCVKVTNYGARIVSVLLPDKNVEEFSYIHTYTFRRVSFRNDGSYFGAIVGRVANRISGAPFTL